MSLLKRLVGSRAFQKIAGVMAAEYLRLVWKTTRFVYEPEDMYTHAETLMPVIIGMWHGQHFLASFLRRHHPGKVLISRHRDGEIYAIAAEHLGGGTVRGSGAHGREHQRKGGVGAFREMVDALAQGYNIALTADVPKISRVAGLGIVKLASVSGRPIFLVAIATRNRITLKNWDRSAVNLPFGPGAVVGVGPIYVPADADAPALESVRRLVETELNNATARAYEMLDGPRRGDARA
jgi:lysophospholipid acyltransferase (LPLAT)-like uncharacterized protein